MLVHNEFHGWEHYPTLCNATTMIDGRCWYNSVSLSVSHDGGRSIRHAATPPAHLVAAASDVYSPDHGAYGVFSPSQVDAMTSSMVSTDYDGFVLITPCASSLSLADCAPSA